MNRTCRRPRGYVLLVTLGLLVLATTLLVALGRVAVDHALVAARSEGELQRRWGTVSVRQAVLPFADEILSRQEAITPGGRPDLRITFKLGTDHFTLILADEQAKANVNMLLDQTTRSSAEDRIRDALSGTGLGAAIALSPSQAAADEAPPRLGPRQWITGVGQMFDFAALSQTQLASATSNLTCWGDGAINLMRAREPALRIALMPALTKLEIGRLVTARNVAAQTTRSEKLPSSLLDPPSANKTEHDPINRLLTIARIDPKKRGQIALTTHSTCFSLWIIDTDRQRTWTSLFVSDGSESNKPHGAAFVW